MTTAAVVTPVKLGAELTIYQVAERYEVLSDLLTRQSELQLDLSEVTEVDSAGIQLLLQLAYQAQQDGSVIHFLQPSHDIQKMMDLFRLNADFCLQQTGDSL